MLDYCDNACINPADVFKSLPRLESTSVLAHVPEKWRPVSEKDMRQSTNLERIPIQPNRDAL
jgi:hypothetical protein